MRLFELGEVSLVPIYLLLPLFAAAIYALASLFVKRALVAGTNAIQVFYFSNYVVALIFLPLLFFEKQGNLDWSKLWQPALVGISFFLGNLTTFLAIRKGDVSVVTPLMGTKVVFVALLAILWMDESPTPSLLIAAGITTLGIFLMGVSDLRSNRPSNIVGSILIALVSASFFAVHDVLVALWAGSFGALTFMVIAICELSLLSFLMWLVQGRPSLRVRGPGSGFAFWGAILIGVQALLMGISLCFFNDATGINIVYASRGLWAIVFVVFLGTMIGNYERRDSGKGFIWRVLGTLLVIVAVILAVIDRSNLESA